MDWIGQSGGCVSCWLSCNLLRCTSWKLIASRVVVIALINSNITGAPLLHSLKVSYAKTFIIGKRNCMLFCSLHRSWLSELSLKYALSGAEHAAKATFAKSQFPDTNWYSQGGHVTGLEVGLAAQCLIFDANPFIHLNLRQICVSYQSALSVSFLSLSPLSIFDLTHLAQRMDGHVASMSRKNLAPSARSGIDAYSRCMYIYTR